jgi:hypothetical protein
MEMSALNNHPDMALAEIAPVLDEAINELGADDRDAILLRFFEHRNLRSVGEALGINENVAQKRVARAVHELAALLRRRGFTLPAAALATGLTAGAVSAAPTGLALSIAGTVLGGAGAAGGAGLTASKVAVMAKFKVGVICATLAAGLVTVLFLQYQSKARLRAESAPVAELAVQPESTAPQPPDEPAMQEAVTLPAQTQPPRVRIAASPPAMPNFEVAPPSARQNAALPVQTAVEYPVLPLGRFIARPGSKLRIEGTANIIHPTWQVESSIIGGTLELGPGFSMVAGQAFEPGPVPAKADAFLSVRSLKSVDENGKPYSDRMNEVMYEHLRAEQYPQIRFDLIDLVLKGATNINQVFHYELEARGVLKIAGVTNEATMPVLILPEANGWLRVSGGFSLSMTSFGIEPIDINLMVGHIKTGDEVSIKFDWVVAPKGASSNRAQPSLVPLILELPAAAFKGTPKDLQVGPNVEPLSDKPRAPMLVPPDLQNLAPDSTVTCSDKNVPADHLAKLIDGNKEASDQSIIFLRKGRQWVQMDLGSPQELFALVIWHAHNMAKVYHDVIVRVADNPDFTEKVRTIFNNDSDNSSGLGVGKDREYFETYEGKLINARGVKARYIRFYSNGSTESALNEYTEIEVYGRQAK